MSSEKEWGFLCTQHGKQVKHCCAFDYTSPNVKATVLVLLNPLFYPDRLQICDHPVKVFPKMIKDFYRILAHIFFSYKNFF
jgi:hypothetical protein